jgi:hypothetical protein
VVLSIKVPEVTHIPQFSLNRGSSKGLSLFAAAWSLQNFTIPRKLPSLSILGDTILAGVFCEKVPWPLAAAVGIFRAIWFICLNDAAAPSFIPVGITFFRGV